MVQKMALTNEIKASLALFFLVIFVGGGLAYSHLSSQEKAEKKVMASGVVAQAKANAASVSAIKKVAYPPSAAATEAKPAHADQTPVPAKALAPVSGYFIRTGDTLARIARRFCDKVPAIVKRNGIKNPDLIQSGTIITITTECSPEDAKKYVSPEKFAGSGGASQEKHNPELPVKKIPFAQKHRKSSSPNNFVKVDAPHVNCNEAAHGKDGWREKTLAIHDCMLSHYGQSVHGAAAETGLKKNLILAISAVESAGNPWAQSHTGCRGFMQLTTSTAKQYGVSRGQIFDPDANIRGGARVFADYLGPRYAKGNLNRAILSYNKGPGTVAQLMRERLNLSSFDYVIKVRKVLHLLDTERKAS
jgi:LysM repeat protein